MCDPTTLLVLSVASSAASFVGGRKQAKDQIEMQNDMAEIQQGQINAAAADEAHQRSRAAARERASMKVQSGESGLAGALPGMLLMDSLMQEGFDKSTMEFNRANKIDASNAESRSRNAQVSAQAPTLFDTGLQIAGAASNYETTMTRRGKDPFWKKG